MSNSKITIICLGKFKEKAYFELEKEYKKRLSPFSKVNIIEIPEQPYRKNADIDRIKLTEAEDIKKHLKTGAIVILLEEKGTLRNSEDFAANLDRLTSLGQELIFVIGSGVGLHESLKEVSNYTLSLSPLTFPHNLARILLLEQIYRAYTIIAGREYHK
ncbi:23S rRNA (pseudouridine(1915)-N(3))-methyltransferase RlmH [bacterium]|nr:MAG: 23S rRNA (pseudouridine(1915)-N(3))-methyltransferase RlmH [bacterium]